ncbi:MAG TPA: small ribosomal subunit Rsm22 family protein [Xanthobacteraceae bacterium]|nr:small ribosomal subunit Rsm22 family protein [Xanthobacteraceae bacterium]
MDAALPQDLRRALDELAQGRSQRELARRAEAISQRYRGGETSGAAVRDGDDALAYALTRMPATYAAASAALAAVRNACAGFAPRTLVDAGAGPGTATFAAAEAFATLGTALLIDDNPHLRALGLTLAENAAATRTTAYLDGDVLSALAIAAPADLVIASYVIGEVSPRSLGRVADALWEATADMLVVIEPGTPAGFARIRTLRARLIAQGAHAIAPCPHDLPCPVVDPDWCHFSQRLPRSREHRQVKGATLAFEDEKFAYVALARRRRPITGARVLAHPRVGKVEVSAKLCTTHGIVTATASRRDRERYGTQKRWSWGDQVAWPKPST